MQHVGWSYDARGLSFPTVRVGAGDSVQCRKRVQHELTGNMLEKCEIVREHGNY